MPKIKEVVSNLISDPDVKAEYQRLEPAYAVYKQLIAARLRAHLSQEEVAARMGTTKSVVSRLESAGYKHQPSLTTIQKFAAATGNRVEINLVPEVDERPVRKRTAQ